MNAPQYYQDATLTSARAAEATAADFAGGMNKGGSNAPGLGIATENGQCKLSDWTVADQAEAARDPQASQHIGEDATAINATDNGTDHNDTFSLTVEGTGWVKNAVV